MQKDLLGAVYGHEQRIDRLIQFDFNPLKYINIKERRRIMALRKIRELGDEVLTKPCKEVTQNDASHKNTDQ